MASNERENARREKQLKSREKNKKKIWIAIGIVVFILIIMKVCEIDFNAVKKYFSNDGEVASTVELVDNMGYPYNIDSAKDVKMCEINGKLNVLTSSSVTVLNPTDANKAYTFDHGYANPILKHAGSYFCLFDQGATRIRLDNNKKNIYEKELTENILTANVNSKGSVIYATHSDKAKSMIYIYNQSLKNKLKLKVNDGYVVAVAIDSSGNKCAYAVVNSKNAKLVTTVYTVDVSTKKTISSFDFNSSILDLHYSSSSDLYFVGNDCVSVITSNKKEKKVFEQGSVSTVCFNYTADDELVYVYSGYSNSTNNTLSYINTSGKVKTKINLDGKAKYVSSSSNEVCVLFPDKVDVYSLTRDKLKDTYPCVGSVNNVTKISSRIYITKQQLVDILDKE